MPWISKPLFGLFFACLVLARGCCVPDDETLLISPLLGTGAEQAVDTNSHLLRWHVLFWCSFSDPPGHPAAQQGLICTRAAAQPSIQRSAKKEMIVHLRHCSNLYSCTGAIALHLLLSARTSRMLWHVYDAKLKGLGGQCGGCETSRYAATLHIHVP